MQCPHLKSNQLWWINEVPILLFFSFLFFNSPLYSHTCIWKQKKRSVATSASIVTLKHAGLEPQTRQGNILKVLKTLASLNFLMTNRMDNKIKSGLLLNDISDHLLVFMTSWWSCEVKSFNGISYRRVGTVESINKFRSNLLKQNWKKCMTNWYW